MRITNSTMIGWVKTGRGEYTHETGCKVVRNSQGWEVRGAMQNDGNTYSTMWVAMEAAASTPAVFVR